MRPSELLPPSEALLQTSAGLGDPVPLNSLVLGQPLPRSVSLQSKFYIVHPKSSS